MGDSMKKTKIIATVGLDNCDKNGIKEMIEAGIDCIRINLSHATHEFSECVIKNVRELNKELNKSIAILIDTKGPEIRVDKFPFECIEIKEGDRVILSNKENNLELKKIRITYRNLYEDIDIDQIIFIDDGLIKLKVIDIVDCDIICESLTDGVIYPKKGVNIPHTELHIDFLSTDDKDDIIFASNMGADYIALSFVRRADDVLDVNDMLIGLKDEHMQIIAKIENETAVEDLENIVKVSDGVMVARGDLGVQIPLEKVPAIQKKISKYAYEKNKICIIATEMMESMSCCPRPTRAEVSDVANAVYDCVDAVMLSNETADGKYPIETIDMMKRIIEEAEATYDYNNVVRNKNLEDKDMTTAVAYSVVNSANMLNAKTIVASTMSGYTAKKVSIYRPTCPIIATTPNKKTALSLALNFGVIPVVTKKLNSTDEIVENAIEVSKDIFKLKEEDKIIITGGFPVKKTKYTNFMKIEEIE